MERTTETTLSRSQFIISLTGHKVLVSKREMVVQAYLAF